MQFVFGLCVITAIRLLLQGQAGGRGYKGDTGLPGYDGIPGAKVCKSWCGVRAQSPVSIQTQSLRPSIPIGWRLRKRQPIAFSK